MTARADATGGAVVVGALGVVFGDIGTSPLYTLRTVLGEGDDLSRATVYGMTSTVVWSLTIVVTVLYIRLLLPVDNEGEGGLLSLVALLRRTSSAGRSVVVLSVLGMVGASMFLGDSIITPAISVLSAAEGLEVVSPGLHVVVLPIALVILAGVFAIQRLGTMAIGRAYGPVMVVWFALLAVTGVVSLAREPAALQALSPTWAVRFLVGDPLTGFLSLGSVILAVTGAEALYADLGHFGRPAIARAWLLVVFPSLVLGYLGEGAAVARHRSAAAEPFYAVIPHWATAPVVGVATLATIIASQAVIAGAFTVLHQAAGLGLFPHLRVRHTSARQKGQIYLPAANWTLAVAVLAVVAGFRSSDRLSAAYGVAVSMTILVTSTLLMVWLQRRPPSRHRALTRAVARGCWVVVLLFAASTVPKVFSGGWLPMAVAAVLLVVMSCWWSGRRRLIQARHDAELSVTEVLHDLDDRGADRVHRVPGSAVFTTHDAGYAPLALAAMMRQNHSLHAHVVLLTWSTSDLPRAADGDGGGVVVDPLGDEYDGVVTVTATLGYRERPDVERILAAARELEGASLEGFEADEAVYFVSVPLPQLTRHGELAIWRQRVFLLLDRLATDPVDRLRLPRDRTITIGRELKL